MSSQRLGARGIGVWVVLAGLLVNRWSLGQLTADDGVIDSAAVRLAILGTQALTVLLGLWLIARDPLRQAPRAARTALVSVAVVAAVVGGYGTGVRAWDVAERWGWIRPRVLPLPELCAWLTTSKEPILSLIPLDHAAAQLEELERAGVAAGAEAERIEARRLVAKLSTWHGRNAEAIALLEAARELAEASGQPPDLVAAIRRELGVAHLRRGEVEHCVNHHNSERCLFPIQGSGVWSDPAGAREAASHFEACLRDAPDDHGTRWLLNVAHMAAGSYPEGLALEHRIPPSRIESSVSLPRFRDVANAVGLDTLNPVGGAIVDDFDNDGWLDVVTSSYLPCAPMLYFRNQGDGTFRDASAASKIADQLGGFNLVQTDFDNDGRLDILVLRGAWQGREFGRQRNSLLRQNPDGTFSDVTLQCGLGDVAYPCQAAAWADYDNDGDLDLFIGNESFPSELFRNNGDGTFSDVAQSAGIGGPRFTKGVDWGDYDNDGDQDLYVSNLGAPNQLYRNLGDGTFEEVAAELGVQGVPKPGDYSTFTSWFFDFDNDGWLDLFLAGYNALLSDVAADYLGLPADAARLELYRNDGKGGFTDVTKQAGLDDIRLPMGANYGDVNGDGFPDIYLGTGRPRYEFLVPNRLYLNIGGERFADATTAAGVGHLQKGHAIAFGDLDNDGDQDIFAQMGGFYRSDAFHNAVFENPDQGNHWIVVRLVGVRSNRAAIGARIAVTVAEAGAERTIYAVVDSGGSFGASSLQQEIGLGSAARILSLDVEWPATGVQQHFEDVVLDQFVEITEGDDRMRTLERVPVRLGGKND